VPFTGLHPFCVLTYPPSAGPACGVPSHSLRLNGHSLALLWRRSHARPRHAEAFRTPPTPLRHTPWAPTPRTLQRRLYQPRQQIRRRKCPWPWQVQCPRLAVPPFIRLCQCPGVRLPSRPCRPSQLCQARGLIRPTAQPTCGPVQRLHWCQRCRLRTPSLCRSHIAIILPCLGNVTFLRRCRRCWCYCRRHCGH